MQALLIDDEIVAVNALKRRVDWSRYHVDQVFTAQSMQEAQEIFRQQKIDFMLCDIEMPNGSGLELFEWVKIYYPLTECVYVTCHPEYKYIRKALKLGSADYILKPIDYKELDEVLCELVKRLDKATENTEKIEKIPDEIMQKLISQNVHTEQDRSSLHEAAGSGQCRRIYCVPAKQSSHSGRGRFRFTGFRKWI